MDVLLIIMVHKYLLYRMVNMRLMGTTTHDVMHGLFLYVQFYGQCNTSAYMSTDSNCTMTCGSS